VRLAPSRVPVPLHPAGTLPRRLTRVVRHGHSSSEQAHTCPPARTLRIAAPSIGRPTYLNEAVDRGSASQAWQGP
jgi:hypothetical protein